MLKTSYPLPSFEIAFHFAVWTVHSLLAIFASIRSTKGIKVGKWLDHWLEPSSYVNGYRMDNSDVELKLFQLACPTTILYLCLSSIFFKITLIFTNNKDLNKSRSLFLIAFWFILHVKWSSFKCVALISALSLLLIVLTLQSRKQWMIWVVALAFIAKISSLAQFSDDPVKYYREFNLYLYSNIKIVNICIYLTRNPDRQIDVGLVIDFMEYMLYPPYSIALIVLFEDFQKQMDAAKTNNSPPIAVDIQKLMTSIALRALRLSATFLLLQALLHVCAVNALFNSPFSMLQNFNNYEVASIAYVAGQLFHMKYVLIFGLPSMFAAIDGMHPPPPPMCISRVAKYSQMWRHFDCGLYKFLKNQVYIPLIGSQQHCPYGLAMRKLFAMCSVFSFVLIWHGFNSNYFWWVSLSAAELCIERLATGVIWPNTAFQSAVVSRLSQANIVRLKALGMLATVIPGIFGIFFFLGQTAGIGHYIFKNVLVDGLFQIVTLNIHFLNAGWTLAHLLAMGYSFNHVCLYLEFRLDSGVQKKCD